MRSAAIILMLVLAAGCGDDGSGEGKADANQLARLSTPEPPPVEDPLALVRLEPLGAGDITSEGLGGPGCSFIRGTQVLVVANEEDAIARIGGRTLHFAPATPPGPSGGFFEERQRSISIGRTDAADTAGSALEGWPARIVVTNRRGGARIERDGLWRCGA